MAADQATQDTARGRSTVEAVADRLRDGIRSGRYMAGQRLVEADITQELNVSRGPVREAFRRLAAEGLVDLQHHRGARVRQMSRAEVAGLFQVREALEGMAANLAARHVPDTPAAAALQELVDAMSAALDAGEVGRYIEMNQAFHEFLIAHSENTHLPMLVRQLQTPLFRLQFRSMIDVPYLRIGHADHIEITDAVISGEPERAEAAIRAHIRRSGERASAMEDDYFRSDQDLELS